MKLAEFQKVAVMLAKEHRITIEEGHGWAANIKRRQVYYRKEDIYNLSEEHILGLLLHEIAHIRYTSDVVMPSKNSELTGSTLNMLEDISIEHIISNDYPNAGEILDSTKGEVLDTLLKILPKMKASVYEKSLLFAAARFEGRGYSIGFEPYEKLGELISQLMLSRKDEIYGRKSTTDLMPLVADIIKLLIKELGQPSDQDKESLGGCPMHGHADEQTKQEQSKRNVINKLRGGRGWKEGAMLAGNVTFVDAIADQATQIGKQLRTVLKRNNAMEFGGRYRTGKLLAKRFVRVKAMKDRRPFARRIVKSNQSYAFAIASDVSGSMFNGYSSNAEDAGSYALSSMHMVAEALRMAGIPRSMVVFGTRSHVAAPMGKAQVRWDQISNENNMKKAHTGGTNIAAAIDACAQELSKVRAERKIMIILTDGQSELSDMIDAHKKATAQGIECLGITLGQQGGRGSYMDRTFSEKKNVSIENMGNTALIGKAFIDILKASITKSQ